MEQRYAIELLHWAGMDNIYEISDILSSNPELINSLNDNKDNSLMVASRLGNFNTVRYLIEDTTIDINHENEEGNALLIAFKYKHIECGSFLINQENINLNTKCVKNKSIAHYIASCGNDKEMEFIISKNIDIGTLDVYNQHCLFDLINNYKDSYYPCFEIIQENMSNEILFTKNIEGLNIIDFMEYLINSSENDFQKKMRILNFELLFNILRQRII